VCALSLGFAAALAVAPVAAAGKSAVPDCAPASAAAITPPSGPALTEAIAAQPLDRALIAFALDTGLQTGTASATLEGLKSPGAHAGLAPAAALKELLKDTGLDVEFQPRGLFNVCVRHARASPAPEVWNLEEALPEVEVTARRHREPQEQVPISIVSWTPERMSLEGVKGMTQIGALTPAVEFDFLSSVGSGVYSNLAIRGVTDRHGTVTAVFLNDITLPPVRSNTFGRALPAALDLLSVGGRIAVLAYHSLEDRAVKRALTAAAADTTPPGLPVPLPGSGPRFRLLTRGALRPSAEEVAANPRAASARLRAAERIREAA